MTLPGQTLAALSDNEAIGGPPVVFIHGITASIQLWLPSMPAEIRDGRHWISLSLPGHFPATLERSTIDAWDDVTPQKWAGWYQAALQQLIGDEAVDIVGWSTGGYTGLTLAAHYPERVRSLMSISGFAIGKWAGTIGLFQRMCLSSLTCWLVRRGFGHVGNHRALFDALMLSGVADRQAFRAASTYEPTMAKWFEDFGRHDPTIIAELFRKISRVDLTEALGRIRCPTLIAGGDSDPYIPQMHPHWIAEKVSAELVQWRGAGHMFFAERLEEYQELLVRWLKQQQ